MKTRMTQLACAICLLPVLGMAATMQTQGDSAYHSLANDQLGSITQALKQIHVDLGGIQQQSGNQFAEYKSMEQEKRTPKTNMQLLADLSDISAFSKNYIYTAGQPNQDSGYSYSFVCQTLEDLKSPFCQSQNPHLDSNDAIAVMPFGGSGQNFHFSTNYINQLVKSVRDQSHGAQQTINQLPSASIVYRTLDSVGNQYDTTDGGKVSAGGLPSRMQELQKAVAAPLSPQYLQALATASTAESNRAMTEVASVGNVMKYNQLKQGQAIEVLLSGLLVQQMRTNYLLEQNLKAIKKLEKPKKPV